MEYRVCMHGGRGASSSHGGDRNTGGTGRRMKFYDKTAKYQGMSKHEFENAIRDKTVEYIGIFNDKGELIVAGTSHSPNAVAVPTNHPRWGEVQDLTHNHPYRPANEPHRTIGASFSTADVTNHIYLGIKGETRAVSNGPNENTYIFRAKPGAKTYPNKMLQHASRAENAWNREMNKTLSKVEKRLAKQGKQLTPGQRKQVIYGTAKRPWQSSAVQSAGYEYIEVKKAHW